MSQLSIIPLITHKSFLPCFRMEKMFINLKNYQKTAKNYVKMMSKHFICIFHVLATSLKIK
jgi:hypothetical protein